MKSQHSIALLVLLICTLHTAGQSRLKKAPLNPDYLKAKNAYEQGLESNLAAPTPLNLNFSTYFKNKSSGKQFPIAFDLRIAGQGVSSCVSAVKHQLNCGACWAFATLGTLESNWLMNGMGEYDLSENNLKNCHGFSLNPCQWGHHFMSTAYLIRGSGPASEMDDPYQPENDLCAGGMTPQRFIPESRYLPEDHDAFKQAIMNNGAVYNTYRSISQNYVLVNGVWTYCYQGNTSTSHAIAIVGWNDTLTTSCGKGAWLVKDSYGENAWDNGFFYIAYQDTLVLKYNAQWPVSEPYDEDLIIHQIDYIGGWPSVGYEDDVAYGLVRHTTQYDEFITHVGTYSVSYGTTLKVDVYQNFDGSNLTGHLLSVPNFYCDFPGFYRIPLNDSLQFEAGEDFYIHICYDSPGSAGYPIAIENYEEGYTDPIIEIGRCWSREETGNWEAWGADTDNKMDICIKAYGFKRVKLNLKTFLQGAFNGSCMDTTLKKTGVLSNSQPFGVQPWNYNGSETFNSSIDSIVDWLLLEIRDTTVADLAAPDSKVLRSAVLLKADGRIVDTVGNVPVFNINPDDSLFVIVYHRNHLPVLTAGPLAKDNGTYSWDFTTSLQKAYQSKGLKEVAPGIYAQASGDADASGEISTQDLINSWKEFVGNSGYLSADFNLDATVDNEDKNEFWLPNIGMGTNLPE